MADMEDAGQDPEYEKADVTGPEDWDIRGELDAADNMVDTVSAGCLWESGGGEGV